MERFAFEVAETARFIRREANRRAAILGSTGAQWRVLARLSRRDGLRQIELAEALDVEPITLCRMVDRLEQAGLVERRKDPEDRRAWRIHLTEAAAPVMNELQAMGDAFHDDMLRGIPAADLAVVRGVFDRIRANLADLDRPMEEVA
ncbi:MarR family winged helix-turn-helix transcriptional regulator [Sphingosinicella terrae]|uniref:MarR family winged helix-turn-helix transcriptional regulator n=1 Tax=Sphingosinicella terrae TaxID=2172047 RepID=UPI0013B3810F|nr:MarR family transcriptional regulator [Sphingosinicella terrae]